MIGASVVVPLSRGACGAAGRAGLHVTNIVVRRQTATRPRMTTAAATSAI